MTIVWHFKWVYLIFSMEEIRLLPTTYRDPKRKLWIDSKEIKSYISFSSSNPQFYESRISCLLTFWVFFPNKSFKLISKYTQKCQYKSLYQKEKKMQHLKFGKLKFRIRKLGVRWAEWDIKLKGIILPETS